MEVLITSGATREPIDRVRFFTNISTGKTGAVIANHFSGRGAGVTFLAGKDSLLPETAKHIEVFETFNDLNKILKKHLSQNKYDAVIHLAAVSDYSVKQIQVGETVFASGKIPGKTDSDQELTIVFKKNFKIVQELRKYASGRPLIFAFKLTDSHSEEERRKAISKLLETSDVDFVVHNDLSEIRRSGIHRFSVFDRHFEKISAVETVSELSSKLFELVEVML